MDQNERGRFLTTDISQKEFIGEIISIDDPMKMLRVKAKVFGLFDGEDISDDMLPWLFPANSASFSSANGGTGDFDVPKVGTFVKVKFPNCDIYSGQYAGIPNINEKVRNEILSQEYENVHVIRYDEDEDLQVYYTPLQGVIMKLKDCTVNITKDQSVHIVTKDGNELQLNSDGETKDGATLYIKCNKEINIVAEGDTHLTTPKCTVVAKRIELGDDGVQEALVLGTTFKKIFENHTHIGAFGIPTSPASAMGWVCPISDTSFTKK